MKLRKSRKSRGRSSALAGLLTALLSSRGVPVRAADATPPDAERPVSFAEAVEEALRANRDLAAVRLGVAAARAAVGTASERPNPDLSIEATEDTPHQTAVIAFPIETAGKRGRRRDLAEAEVKIGEAGLSAAEVALRADVRRGFYRLIAAERTEEDVSARRDLAARLEATAWDRFESGDAARLEVLRTGLDLAAADDELGLKRAERGAAADRLKVLLARHPSRGMSVSGTLDAPLPLDRAAILGAASAANARLLQLDRELEAADARLALARAQRYPDPALSAGVSHDSPPDFTWGWRAGLSLQLPLFTTHRPAVEVAEQERARKAGEREALALRVESEAAAALDLVAAREEACRRFREVLAPRADELERLAEESWRAGQSGLGELLQALRDVRDIRSRGVQAGLDYQLSLADLEETAGVILP